MASDYVPVPVWCVVNTGGGVLDVMRMRVSRYGTLCGYGSSNSDAMFHLGHDRSRWPALHETQEGAMEELIERQSQCRHQWRHNDDERICERCGRVDAVYCEEDVLP